MYPLNTCTQILHYRMCNVSWAHRFKINSASFVVAVQPTWWHKLYVQQLTLHILNQQELSISEPWLGSTATRLLEKYPHDNMACQWAIFFDVNEGSVWTGKSTGQALMGVSVKSYLNWGQGKIFWNALFVKWFLKCKLKVDYEQENHGCL